jgi:dienelactone hydrolase
VRSGPLAALALAAALFPTTAAAAGAKVTPVTFPGADGWQLAGSLYAPEDSAGPGPAVLLLPMLGHTRETYDRLARALAAAGVRALAVDLRGHGDSTRKGGETRRWKQFTAEDWAGLPRDAAAALRYLRGVEGVDPARTALVGASIGANAAAIAAAEEKGAKALVLLSPGLDYHGLRPLQAIIESGIPTLALSGGDEDEGSRATLEEMRRRAPASAAPGTIETQSFAGGGHGTDLLENRDAAFELVLKFLQGKL